MEQAARSGERNIGEGSKLSATTQKLEMNLTNVARASIDELRKDYEDFLEQRKLPLWEPMDLYRQTYRQRLPRFRGTFRLRG